MRKSNLHLVDQISILSWYSKYINGKELNTKIALEDLKFTFANILKTDFFAKKLEYHVVKGFKDKTLSA